MGELHGDAAYNGEGAGYGLVDWIDFAIGAVGAAVTNERERYGLAAAGGDGGGVDERRLAAASASTRVVRRAGRGAFGVVAVKVGGVVDLYLYDQGLAKGGQRKLELLACFGRCARNAIGQRRAFGGEVKPVGG